MQSLIFRQCSCALRTKPAQFLRRPLPLPVGDFGRCPRAFSSTARYLATAPEPPQSPSPSTSPPTPSAPASSQSQPEPAPAHQKPTDKPKTKNKPTTTLRRTASESLPIRSKAAREIRPVFTVSTAERYDLRLLSRSLATALPAGWRTLPAPEEGFEEAVWVPRWGEGEAFVFRNGSYVCWGIDEEEALRFGKEVIRSVKGVEVSPLKKLETEELDFVVDPNEQTRLQGDLIILGSSSSSALLARYAFSQALARSSALSALESSLDAYLVSVASLPETLTESGEPRMERRELTKKLGELMRFRQGVNLNRESFSDTPDFYWTEPELEGYFDSVSRALEIRGRMKAMNEKITYAAETQEVLRQLLTDATAHRMELIIIALIAVEVVIAIVRDGPELWHMFFGPREKKHEHQLET